MCVHACVYVCVSLVVRLAVPLALAAEGPDGVRAARPRALLEGAVAVGVGRRDHLAVGPRVVPAQIHVHDVLEPVCVRVSVSECVRVRVCRCVCVHVRECRCVSVSEYVCVCVCVRVRECLCVYVRLRVFLLA